MTRAFIPSQPPAGFDRIAAFAQPLRSPGADFATDSASFGDLLSEATQTRSGDTPDLAEALEPDRESATTLDAKSETAERDPQQQSDEPDRESEPEQHPADEREPVSRETSEPEADVRTGSRAESGEQTQATEAAPEHADPRNDTNAETHQAAEQSKQNSGARYESENEDQPRADQPQQPRVSGEQSTETAAAQQPEQIESHTPESATREGGVAVESNAATGPETRGVDPRVQSEEAPSREQSIQAPTAEDQKRESIAVETRFDAAIRDKVRNAAKIDLAALAAEKLTNPTQRIPGDLREAPDPAPALDPKRAHADRPTEVRAPAQPNARQAQVIPNTEVPAARSSAESRQTEPTQLQTTKQESAANTNANSRGSGGETGSRSTTHQAHIATTIAAASTQATQPASGAKSFDRAITALRALGNVQGKVRSQAAKAQHTPGSQPSPGADRARPLLTQVSRGVASILRQEGGSLSLKLRPDTLGELKINLRVQNGSVEATFKADNAQARDLLKSTLSQLKETLETNGVRVDRLRVELADTRPQDAAAPRSEHQGNGGDGSPGFENPSETGGRDGESRHDRHGSRRGPHGRGEDHGSAEPEHDQQHAGLDAEAIRDEQWIGVDTLA